MFDYAEACPISKAASLLCERWTLQIIREMLMGATRFSEFQKYLPKISPTLLNSRLRSLEAHGLIVRKRIPEKRGFEYQLTPSGKALQPLLTEFGKWGMNWVFRGMEDEELNISTIVRDFAMAMDTQELPSGDTVIQLTVQDVGPAARNFILVRGGHAQVCDDNIGHEVDVYLRADLKTLYQIWFGEIGVDAARQRKLMQVVGPPIYEKTVARWLRTSQFAKYNVSCSDPREPQGQSN